MITRTVTDQLYIGDSPPLLVLGSQIVILIPGEATGGAYAILEDATPPGGGASYLHTHPPQETFYVLEGEYEIYGQNETGKYVIRAVAGMSVHVPGQAPHGYRNVGQTVGKLLMVLSPAGVVERFLEEIGAPVGVAANPPDAEAIMRAFKKYDMRMLEAPPVPEGEQAGTPA